jgi:chaperonin GroES
MRKTVREAESGRTDHTMLERAEVPAQRRRKKMAKVKTKIQPLQDRILVKRLDADEEKVGGIIIPDTAKEKPQEGEVVAVGPGKVTDDGKRQAVEVKEGDKILFAKYAGTEVKLDGEEYLIMREDDVLAVLR